MYIQISNFNSLKPTLIRGIEEHFMVDEYVHIYPVLIAHLHIFIWGLHIVIFPTKITFT